MNPRLERWYVGTMDADPYKAPEQMSMRLFGNVHNDWRFLTGEPIHTSAIRGKCGDCVVTKSGTHYELGEVDPGYEHAYPGARERLFKTLPEVQP